MSESHDMQQAQEDMVQAGAELIGGIVAAAETTAKMVAGDPKPTIPSLDHGDRDLEQPEPSRKTTEQTARDTHAQAEGLCFNF